MVWPLVLLFVVDALFPSAIASMGFKRRVCARIQLPSINPGRVHMKRVVRPLFRAATQLTLNYSDRLMQRRDFQRVLYVLFVKELLMHTSITKFYEILGTKLLINIFFNTVHIFYSMVTLFFT